MEKRGEVWSEANNVKLMWEDEEMKDEKWKWDVKHAADRQTDSVFPRFPVENKEKGGAPPPPPHPHRCLSVCRMLVWGEPRSSFAPRAAKHAASSVVNTSTLTSWFYSWASESVFLFFAASQLHFSSLITASGHVKSAWTGPRAWQFGAEPEGRCMSSSGCRSRPGPYRNDAVALAPEWDINSLAAALLPSKTVYWQGNKAHSGSVQGL